MTDPFAPDLCDRCGARGQARYRLASGLSLVFCNHHSYQHGSVLMRRGAVFFPLRDSVLIPA